MKAAIALFGSRISPRFDCTDNFLVITVADHTVTDRVTKIIDEPLPFIKARRLADLNVDTVICGGVDIGCVQSLNSHGIRVVSDIKGEAEDALANYLKGEFH